MLPPPQPISLLYKSLQKFVTLDITWLMTLEAKDLRAKRTPGDVALRRLSEQDVRSHSLLPDYQLAAEDADRLRRASHECLAAFVDNQLAAYAWYAFEGVAAKLNRGADDASGVALTYPRSMVFLYKGFTHPKFQARGLIGLIQQHALRTFNSRGINTLLSTAEWNDKKELENHQRVGFRPVGRIFVAGAAGETVLKVTADAKAIDVRAGKSISELRARSSKRCDPIAQTRSDGRDATPRRTAQSA
ncbi:MAG: hypothetical protein RH917_01120 [Lacipirellulaceae bacterium]